jgi:hypothetical protein
LELIVNGAVGFALIFVGFIGSTVTSDSALRLTNVTIQMVRNDRTHRIEAKVSNPNGFAVFDVVAACDFRDRHSQIISTSDLKVTDAVQGNATRIIRDLDFAEWPTEARTAACVSLEAKRLPD